MIDLQDRGFRVKVIADSIAPNDWRLTSLECTFWRATLAEVNTHRMFSRNSASSRAIPVEKRVKDLTSNGPFVPPQFGKNQKGMQSREPVDEEAAHLAEEAWLIAAGHAIQSARRLGGLDGVIPGGVHKQHANRVLEPYLWHTALISATHWENWHGLRAHPDAQPEVQILGTLIKRALKESTPEPRAAGEWHLPYVLAEERREMTTSMLLKVSVARCCRLSYLTQDGRKSTDEDIARHDGLLKSGHMSPLEHQAQSLDHTGWGVYARAQAERWVTEGIPVGNFAGWKQYRKTIESEHDFSQLVRGST